MVLLKRPLTNIDVRDSRNMLFADEKFGHFAFFRDDETDVLQLLRSFHKPVLLADLDDVRSLREPLRTHYAACTGTVYVLPLLSLTSSFLLPSLRVRDEPQKVSAFSRRSFCKHTKLQHTIVVKDLYLFHAESTACNAMTMEFMSPSEYLTNLDYVRIAGRDLDKFVGYEDFCRALYASNVTCIHEYAVRKRRYGS